MASELEKAVRSLAEKSPGWKQFLPERQPVAPVPAQRGVGRAQVAQAASGTGGGSLAVRLGTPLTVTSSDGIFQWEYSQTVIVTIEGTDYTLPAVLP